MKNMELTKQTKRITLDPPLFWIDGKQKAVWTRLWQGDLLFRLKYFAKKITGIDPGLAEMEEEEGEDEDSNP